MKFKQAKRIKVKLEQKKCPGLDEIAYRLIFTLKKKEFAVDFTIDGKKLSSSGFVNELKDQEPFEEFAHRYVGD